ncbi:hypothetical protein GCM10011363_39820 [Marivita lacus]|uniref:Uncharacterized protein n=1 Tax=Marivita lacus TaxID=1323742 RepID=A0ABQ1L3R6_9RHOB|nr:hypothetical protein GCM10011363_39820 [Marivita lacus]
MDAAGIRNKFFGGCGINERQYHRFKKSRFSDPVFANDAEPRFEPGVKIRERQTELADRTKVTQLD